MEASGAADKDKAKAAVRMLKKKWVSYLSKLVALTRSKLDKVNKKASAITIEVHAIRWENCRNPAATR